MSEEQFREELARSQKQIQVLHQRLTQLEQGNRTGVPDTMLLSDSFIKRAFAVLGHYLVAALIIAVPFYFLIFLFIMSFGASFF